MESTEKRLQKLSGAAKAAKARPVYAIPLEGPRGLVGENWPRVPGRASTAEEAKKLVREAGYRLVIKGGRAEVSPGEVVDEDEDVWVVTVRG